MTEFEHKKLCMARHIYRRNWIDRELPSSIRSRKRNTKAKRKTWGIWWQERYGEEFSQYVSDMIARKRAA